MRTILMAASALGALALAGGPAAASTCSFDFGDGGGVSGHITLTYGTAADATYPQALVVTGISGVVTDTNGTAGLSMSRSWAFSP
jgi:hypothetical protein